MRADLHLESIVGSGSVYVMAVDSSEAIRGYVSATYYPEDGELAIEDLDVDVLLRRKGHYIGTKLVKHLVTEATELGASVVTADLVSEASIGLFTRLYGEHSLTPYVASSSDIMLLRLPIDHANHT